MDVLVAHGAELLLHLGDIGTVEVIDAVAFVERDGRRVPARVVFGNTDWDAPSLSRYAQSLGVSVDDPVGKLELPGGRELVFLHGHDEQAMAQALAGKPAFLCHGHTHRPRDEKKGGTRMINPGALFRAQRYTVALLDTGSDELAFYDVEDR